MSDAILTDRPVTVQRDGPVVTLVLSRPERRNPLSHETMTELTERLRETGDDPSVRAVVLGAQGTAFCAGHDIDELATRDAAVHERVFAACAELMLTIHRLRQPVIARVQGIATAAGCQLVAACDLAVAAEARGSAPRGQDRPLLHDPDGGAGPGRRPDARDGDAAHRRADRRPDRPGLGPRQPGRRPSTSTTRPSRSRGASPPRAARRSRSASAPPGRTSACRWRRAYRHASGVMPQRRHRRRPGGHRGLPGEATAGLEPVTPQRTDPAADFAALRDDLGELATLTLEQVERAIAGWEDSDPRSPRSSPR